MEKHSAYFKLLERLHAPECAICAAVRSSLHTFLDSYLYEGVTDDTNWNRLSAAGGWCPRHARQMEGFSDGLAVSLFYRHLIRKRIATLGKGSPTPGRPFFASPWFGREGKPEPCPGCLHQAEVEAGQVRVFASALGEEEFWKELEAHSGLCLSHSESVLAALQEPLLSRFKELSGRQLELLCAELDEIVRKSDTRTNEGMGSQGDAWKRALRRCYGPQYGL
ncbi:MAG: hypothetical protein V4498_07650 [candidate division FCPU426 bacterium]